MNTRLHEMHPLCCLSTESFGGGPDFSQTLSEYPMLSRSRSLPATCAPLSARSNANAGTLHPGSASPVAGILYKWTNYGKGWRSRCFLLRDAVLSYSKIRRPEILNILTTNIKLIGEVPTNRLSRLDSGGGRRKAQKSTGVAHLKVIANDTKLEISSFRESKSDDRRFYIFTATMTLHLRADSKRDRAAWMQALHTARGLSPPRRVNDNLSLVPSALSVSTKMLKERLLEEGMDETLVKDCEKIMLSEFSEIRGQLQVLCEERSNLIDSIRQLEAANIEAEAADMHGGEYQLSKHDFLAVKDQKYGVIAKFECSPTESSDDIETKELENTSDEDEISFYDTMENFPESSASCGPGTPRADSSCIDASREFGSEYDNVRKIKNESCTSGELCNGRRQRLPSPVEREKQVSLWSIIKDNVGKDLSRVCLPVYFNEPISSLQKCCEDLEYSYLLDRAYEHGKMGDSLLRALHVAAFAVSGYASSEGRHCKPFNPLLGETYEADYPEKGIRFFSEKVSHHPTLLACHCEGRGWKFWGDSNLHSKFWGRSIQLEPVGVLTVEFDDGEIFQWSKVTTNIYNLILGKVYCDHHGIMHIRGNKQHSCKLTFKEQFILDRNPHQVHGYVEDVIGKRVATLIGKWDDCMYYVNGVGGGYSKGGSSLCDASLLWKSHKPPPNLTRYNLSSFAITLNELTEGLKERLPPTDSRLRPDQRHLENGEYDKANEEKQRLEKRQRISRKLQENGWRPRWFQREREDGPFRYVGGYWEAREAGNWEDCPDIFGELSEELATN